MVNEITFVSDYMDVFSCEIELGNPFFFYCHAFLRKKHRESSILKTIFSPEIYL